MRSLSRQILSLMMITIICVRVASSCVGDKDCKGDQRCFKGTCRKPENLDQCTKPSDCHEDAVCHREKCHCRGHTVGGGFDCKASLPCPKEYHCDSNALCVVDPKYPKNPYCRCHLDFKKSNDGTCVEMNECEKIGNPCSGRRGCKQVDGNYGCFCMDGFTEVLDKYETICKDIDECKSPDTCPANSHCTNTEGAFKCDCKAGFQKTADGVCEMECACLPNGECNDEGRCSCFPGYFEYRKGQCEDINECAADESPCTDDGTECRNHRGWFSCPCKLGFVKRYDKCVEEEEEECNCAENEECYHGECIDISLLYGSSHSAHVSSQLSAYVFTLIGHLAFSA
ncbi:latent-transforming growth factor beta-binding protein 3-like [Pocillopora verrucosa]|uniref:latent-transforming growth factor beta-binding protein 3-like n=1 Tax=Pocillopora verrucosa TaxID=203993 RepID=UPI002797B0B2|nr:latent-transforming growth factor beta-binding protein 4-like [Pocillopora verrucosa]